MLTQFWKYFTYTISEGSNLSSLITMMYVNRSSYFLQLICNKGRTSNLLYKVVQLNKRHKIFSTTLVMFLELVYKQTSIITGVLSTASAAIQLSFMPKSKVNLYNSTGSYQLILMSHESILLPSCMHMEPRHIITSSATIALFLTRWTRTNLVSNSRQVWFLEKLWNMDKNRQRLCSKRS